ncbi:hypothetical protein C8Q76DRAFT_695824 [Earliella scabrosa]|nr:hypothetical protein C8Q76DRAFT_695824 [Earliella scabrosa]
MLPQVMPLHEQALISLGNSDVKCKVHMVAGDLYGGEEREVFFLFAEYGKDFHVIFICELVDGSTCADPPTVLFRVTIPDDNVKFDFLHFLWLLYQSQHAVEISRQTFRFSLHFDAPADFWEVARTIAEAQAAHELFKQQVEELEQEVLRHVPTTRLPGSGAMLH